MDMHKFNELFGELKNGPWQETIFANLETRCCEEGLYALRLDHGTDRERYVLINAKSEAEAVAVGACDCRRR